MHGPQYSESPLAALSVDWLRFSARSGSAIEHCDRQPRDANELVALINDADSPNVTAFTQMNGLRRADDKTLADCTNMIRVDLLAHDRVFRRIDYKPRSNTAERLGQSNGRAAVQNAENLAGSIIHRHSRTQEIIADLEKFHPEM